MEENTNPENNTSEQINTTDAPKTRKGIDFLRELCSFNADFNAREPQPNPVTNRVQYIMHQLEANNVPYERDLFRADGVWNQEMRDDHNKYINLYVRIAGLDATKTVVFSSHHDVVNKASENCEDNSASVANLIDLAIQLSKEQPPCNVVISFLDGEEIQGMNYEPAKGIFVTPYNGGSNRMAMKIKAREFGDVKFIYHLELTANGTHYWYSFQNQPNAPVNPAANHLKQLHPAAKRVKTPYSDSIPMEMHLLPSVCIGSLIESEMEIAKLGDMKKPCGTWAVCHSEHDLFETFAVEQDMDAFVLFMRSLL